MQLQLLDPENPNMRAVKVKCCTKFAVVQMFNKDEPNKHLLRVLVLHTARHFKSFLNQKPVDHKFEVPIVDYCFSPDNSTLYICLKDGRVLVRDAKTIDKPDQNDKVFVQLPGDITIREIICFNNQTLLVATTTKQLFYVFQKTVKEKESYTFDYL